ncbi:hypothetical protein EZS27_001353 [termite gut metagenome]|uniref:Uncharacterized protein n=1 Tax=termite gut metagenome TaxID=433724 RepID=A0A5J4SYW7_9ZZZZ
MKKRGNRKASFLFMPLASFSSTLALVISINLLSVNVLCTFIIRQRK